MKPWPEKKNDKPEYNKWGGEVRSGLYGDGFNEGVAACKEVVRQRCGEERIYQILSGSVQIYRGITETLSAPNETLRRFASAISKAVLGDL